MNFINETMTLVVCLIVFLIVVATLFIAISIISFFFYLRDRWTKLKNMVEDIERDV